MRIVSPDSAALRAISRLVAAGKKSCNVSSLSVISAGIGLFFMILLFHEVSVFSRRYCPHLNLTRSRALNAVEPQLRRATKKPGTARGNAATQHGTGPNVRSGPGRHRICRPAIGLQIYPGMPIDAADVVLADYRLVAAVMPGGPFARGRPGWRRLPVRTRSPLLCGSGQFHDPITGSTAGNA